jgi:polyhydroxybutyrate depolymerase
MIGAATSTPPRWLARLALVLPTLAGCGWADPGDTVDGPGSAPTGTSVGLGTRESALEHDGVTRTFLVHVPPSYDPQTPVPVVLAFHGGIGSGERLERSTGYSELSDQEGFLVVYPDGIDNRWNDGRTSGEATPDDVGFVEALITHLDETYAVDTDRVYAVGNSNGGIFTQRLACEIPDRFAAVTSVAGSLADGLDETCRPAGPPSVLMINGTDDPRVPFGGGPVGGRQEGDVLPVPDTIARWAELNGCRTAPRTTRLPDRDESDGTSVELVSFVGCDPGRSVAAYVIRGGGHGWPGSEGPSGPGIGTQTNELDATLASWEFFAPLSSSGATSDGASLESRARGRG